MSGQTAAAGARGHLLEGATYLFEEDAGGPQSWGQVKKVVAADGETDDQFGVSVGLNGDLLAVGARGDAQGGIASGSVYLFGRDVGGAGQWGQIKNLVPSDPQDGAAFGFTLGLDGDTLIVGALLEDVAGETDAGAVYVFERNAGGADNWGEVRKLTAPVVDQFDDFGRGVAIDGDTIVVSGSSGRGAIFERNAGGVANWGAVKSLLDANGDVGVSGDTCVVGHDSAFVTINGAGRINVYERNSGGPGAWGKVADLEAPLPERNARLGAGLAIGSDSTVIAGAPGQDPGGAAYAFALRASCPASPAAGCVDTWAKATFSATGRTVEKSNLTLKLSKGPALSQSDFGNPLALGGTAYDLCVYDDQDRLAAWLRADRAGQQCGSRDCWKWWQGPPPSGVGFRYADKELLSDGLSKIDLKGGASGKTSIAVGAKNGDRVPFPIFRRVSGGSVGVAAALAGSDSVTVQLHASDAECFSKTLSNVSKNDGFVFKAR